MAPKIGFDLRVRLFLPIICPFTLATDFLFLPRCHTSTNLHHGSNHTSVCGVSGYTRYYAKLPSVPFVTSPWARLGLKPIRKEEQDVVPSCFSQTVKV